MAILGAVPGLEVTVRVDNVPLQEYNDDEDVRPKPGPVGAYQFGRTVTKYVESISDKDFSVALALRPGYTMDCPSLSAWIFIDGRLVDSPVISRDRIRSCIRRDNVITQLERISRGKLIPSPTNPDEEIVKAFKFSRILTTLDEEKLQTLKDDMGTMNKIGEIRVELHRTAKPVRSFGGASAESQRGSNVQVHEKALKGQAKSHSTEFGSAVKVVSKSYVKCEKLDGQDYPRAIFKFKYRSRDALKSLLIIDRTPSPEPERVLAPARAGLPDDLNEEEEKKLSKFLRDLRDNGDSATNTPPRAVKREREDERAESSRKRRPGVIETVDLTGDSDDDDVEENIVSLN